VAFIGHTKGAPEAIANAYETNRDALVFNPAEFIAFWYTSTGVFTGDIRTFIVDSEILDFVMVMGLLRGGGSDASYGELIRLPRPDNDSRL
jgi:hypothetical protein